MLVFVSLVILRIFGSLVILRILVSLVILRILVSLVILGILVTLVILMTRISRDSCECDTTETVLPLQKWWRPVLRLTYYLRVHRLLKHF